MPSDWHILKCAIQWFFMNSQRHATITKINFSTLLSPKKKSIPFIHQPFNLSRINPDPGKNLTCSLSLLICMFYAFNITGLMWSLQQVHGNCRLWKNYVLVSTFLHQINLPFNSISRSILRSLHVLLWFSSFS